MGLVALWYGLSINDMHFGYLMLSRLFNDAVFDIYGSILGMDAASVRALLIKAFALNTLYVAAIIYFKPFSRIKALWVSWRRKSEANHLVETAFDDPYASHSAQVGRASLSPLKENSLSNAP